MLRLESELPSLDAHPKLPLPMVRALSCCWRLRAGLLLAAAAVALGSVLEWWHAGSWRATALRACGKAAA